MSAEKDLPLETIAATIRRGLGAARGNLAAQLSKIVTDFPEIGSCFLGTLNLELSCALKISSPDFISEPLEWMPNVIERFALTRIELEFPIGGHSYAGWIYSPELTPHRFNARYLEIIAPKIDGAAVGSNCCLRIERHKIASASS